jgi:hypothetical protein
MRFWKNSLSRSGQARRFPLEYKGRCPRLYSSPLVYFGTSNRSALTDYHSSPAAPRAQGSRRERNLPRNSKRVIVLLASCPSLPLRPASDSLCS